MEHLDDLLDALERREDDSLVGELRRLNRNLESTISGDLSDESIDRLKGWFDKLESDFESVIMPEDETERRMTKARAEMQRAYIRGVNERTLDAMEALDHALSEEVVR
jgi:hypothetical protein